MDLAQGLIVLPGSSHCSRCLCAAKRLHSKRRLCIEGSQFGVLGKV
jgi:hypothetical protein